MLKFTVKILIYSLLTLAAFYFLGNASPVSAMGGLTCDPNVGCGGLPDFNFGGNITDIPPLDIGTPGQVVIPCLVPGLCGINPSPIPIITIVPTLTPTPTPTPTAASTPTPTPTLTPSPTPTPTPTPTSPSISVSGSSSCEGASPATIINWVVSDFSPTEHRVFRGTQLITTPSLSGSSRSYSDTNPEPGLNRYRVESRDAAGTIITAGTDIPTAVCSGTPTNLSYLWRFLGQTSLGSNLAEVLFPDRNPTTIRASDRCAAAGQTGTLQVTVTGSREGKTVIKTDSQAVRITRQCTINVSGDIFGRDRVSSISVDPSSVVSSNNIEDSVSGSELEITGYQPINQLDWQEVQNQADPNNPQGAIAKLIAEKARTIQSDSRGDYYITSRFNLNPVDKSNPLGDRRIDSANPEGSVWYVPGNLHIGTPNATTKILGRGTIIVAGRVIFQGRGGRIEYENPSDVLGIISLSEGDDTILLKDLVEIEGAFFAPRGTLRFDETLSSVVQDIQGGESSVNGLFIANKIIIDPTADNLRISYDGRIIESPPPGFFQTVIPALSEVNP